MELSSAASDDTPRLSVVIVNWNGADYLRECVASAVGSDREVIVVDNGSSDGSESTLDGLDTSVRWLPNGANLGFASAANRGLESAHGRFVLFLNPDARANDVAIDAAIGVLENRPSVGLVGVAHRSCAGELVPTVEPFFSLATLLRARWTDRVRAPGGPDPVEVDWCHGAFLLGRRADLVDLGGFDEEYFLYAEDMDLCFRVRERGLSVVYLSEVSIVHDGNRAGQVALGERRAAAILASSLRFHARHHGRLATLVLRAAAAGFFAARALGYALVGSRRAVRYGALAGVAIGAGAWILPWPPRAAQPVTAS